MYFMKVLPVIFIALFFSLTLSSRDLIEDVYRISSDFKVCIDALRSDRKSSSADKKGLVHLLQCLTKTKNIYNKIISLLEQVKNMFSYNAFKFVRKIMIFLIDNSETTIKNFNENDFPGAMSVVSGVASAPDTSEETFNQAVKIFLINSKDDDFINFINLTASLMNQFGK